MADEKDKEAEVAQRWFILEQLGHKRLAGYVQPEPLAGVIFVRIDIMGLDVTRPPKAIQYINPTTIYALTPSSEELCRRWGERFDTTALGAVGMLPAPQRRDDDDDDYEPDDEDDRLCKCGHDEEEHYEDGQCTLFYACQCRGFKRDYGD